MESDGTGTHTGDEHDGLRITVEPRKAPHSEWIVCGFEDLADTQDADSASVVAFLHWEEKMIAFKVQSK